MKGELDVFSLFFITNIVFVVVVVTKLTVALLFILSSFLILFSTTVQRFTFICQLQSKQLYMQDW